MQKLIVSAIILVIAAAIACSPKVSTATASATDGAAIISSAKCTKCHSDESKHVPNHAFEEQEKLFINMAGKAKLTWAETQSLMAYVKANSK